MHFRASPHTRARAALVAGVAALSACTDAPTTPTAAAPRPAVATVIPTIALRNDRLATIEYEGRFPALYIQNADRSGRFRVRFTNVHDKIAGNYSQDMLPVSDETIIAMGPAKWSPDGQQLALVVSVAFDQSEVLVMGADGRNIRAASVNSQWIMGDIDWSPDSRKIAYTMSTEPLVRHVDLFVTDLMKDEVRRLTTRGTFGPWDQYRWDPAGKRLYFTAFYGWTEDEANRVFNVNWVDASGAITGTDRRIVGDPQGLARDGAWALVTRSTRTDRGPLRELARVPLTGGGETVLATGDLLQYAKLLERDDEAVLVSQDLSDPYSDLHRYDLVGLAQPNDVHAALPVAPNAASVALLRAGR